MKTKSEKTLNNNYGGNLLQFACLIVHFLTLALLQHIHPLQVHVFEANPSTGLA